MQKGIECFNQAIAELKAGRRLDDNPLIVISLEVAYMAAGKPGETEKALAELQQLSTTRSVDPFCFATIYAALGDQQQTFAWLDKSYANRSLDTITSKFSPVFKRMQSDPRVVDLVRRVGLPQ